MIVTDKPPMLIIVPKQFKPGYAVAQASHAVAGYVEKFGNEKSNGYVYSLVVATIDCIKIYADMLEFLGIDYFAFFEPDLNIHTAICCVTNPKVLGKIKKMD